jgi:hypothetical protein
VGQPDGDFGAGYPEVETGVPPVRVRFRPGFPRALAFDAFWSRVGPAERNRRDDGAPDHWDLDFQTRPEQISARSPPSVLNPTRTIKPNGKSRINIPIIQTESEDRLSDLSCRARILLSWLSHPIAAGIILLAFWVAMVASLWSKSLTVDEATHAAAGYAYWRFDDYRLDPENGNLPQRWIALPLLAGHYVFPAADSEIWIHANEGAVGERWFDRMGNDTVGMMVRGRAMSGLLAVALGGLVWWWSRRLFGPEGGLISLLLFVLDPTILANGALMTSDTACALFFLASLAGVWSVLHRISTVRVLLSALAMGGLFVSKMSAILIVPIALVLGLIRVFAGPPVALELGGRRSLAASRSRAAAFLAVAILHVAVVAVIIWGFNGFRYQPFGPGSTPGSRLEMTWTELVGLPGAAARPAVARVLAYFRDHRLLPEAYLFGQAYAWKFSQFRSAFLNGRFSLTGWWWFFPYTFLVKTPLPIFGVILLAALALRRRSLYGTIPLALFFGAYWIAAITSRLNVGHRHILAAYPPLFVLCGAAGWWLAAQPPAAELRKTRTPRLILVGLMMMLALETTLWFPNYLSYVNVIAGGSARGYRHLVDSSLDWGQDLPGVKRYIEKHPGEGPAYLAYFGTASPNTYHIPAHYLHFVLGTDVPPPMGLLNFPLDHAKAQLANVLQQHPEYQVVAASNQPDGRLNIVLLKSPASLRLNPGTYFISASMVQPVLYDLHGPLGPWNERYERTYQMLYSAVKPLLGDDLTVRYAALATHTPKEWAVALDTFEMFRFARLTAYLRQREPLDTVNGSILVYRLSEADIVRAVDGPPPERGSDFPVQSGQYQPPPLP